MFTNFIYIDMYSGLIELLFKNTLSYANMVELLLLIMCLYNT
jgi:hypothetical protein